LRPPFGRALAERWNEVVRLVCGGVVAATVRETCKATSAPVCGATTGAVVTAAFRARVPLHLLMAKLLLARQARFAPTAD